ncbi:ATP-binding protein [bacterium]|nr:ATP-binding protein [bacterium]
MFVLTGPRQVGKTTASQSFSQKYHYFNWDNQDHRKIILKGPKAIVQQTGIHQLQEKPVTLIFDEIHKYPQWKTFIKGFFDVYQHKTKIIITGSSRLDVFKKGGDSLMGRYFLYRMHPLSVGELLYQDIPSEEYKQPRKIEQNKFQDLLDFGGFPEPFLKRNKRFSNRWKNLRQHQLFKEDIRALTRVQQIGQIEILAELIKNQVGQLTNYSNLAVKINVSVDTIRRWLKILESLYFCFFIRPGSKNISRSLIKEPKIFLWDWSLVEDKGARYENFIASHLLKSVQWWQDNGLGEYNLYFLRDKMKREVDFLVTKNSQPWFLVEVKSSSKKPLSKELKYFQAQSKADHAFQIVFDMDFVNKNCFSVKEPVIVPAQTFLSQLI